MKARCLVGAAAALFVLGGLGGFGCEAAHQRALVSYPESVCAGSSDSIGGAVFSPRTQDRMQARKVAEETGTAIVLIDPPAN